MRKRDIMNTEPEDLNSGRPYEYALTVSASVTFNKGVKALREGAYDAYDTVMFRYNSTISRTSALVWVTVHGRSSFNRDYEAKTDTA